MKHSFEILGYDEQERILKIRLDEPLNIERLKTYYADDLGHVKGELVLSDPRRFNPRQRALYRALLNDIYKHFGMETEITHEFFKEEYYVKYGSFISTKDLAETSIEQMHQLTEIVIDFMFEFGVPFKKGYELLPREEQYFYYLCLKHRKCVICGKQADICHVDTVGMGRDRKSIDHSQMRFYAGCRVHHQLEHSMGTERFLTKFKIMPIKLDHETRKKLRIGG